MPPAFERAAETYLNLVKSRVIGALVVNEEMIVPSDLSPEVKFGLLAPLCAYFTARTDMELERRGVPPHLREFVWGSLPDIVLEEMEFSRSDQALTRTLILGQTGMLRGVMETKGHANAAALAKTFAILARGARGVAKVDGFVDLESLEAGVSVLLIKYEQYIPYIDRLAASWKAQAL